MAAELTATNTITFRAGSGASTHKFVGEVWRYLGAAGGANEFIVRGRVAVTLGNGVASNTAAISGIVAEGDCVPFMAGLSSDQTSTNDYDASTVGVRLDGSGNVEVSRQSTTGSVTVYVTVVEFTGSNWIIASGVSASHDSTRELVTLNADVGDWGKAWLEATGQGDTAETGLADIMFLAYPAAATNQVYVDYQEGDGNARNDGTAYVYAIANSQSIVSHNGSSDQILEGNNSYGTQVVLPAAVNLNRLLSRYGLSWFTTTSGKGTAHARGALGARITGNEGYSQGDVLDIVAFDRLADITFNTLLTFNATPDGCITELGGTRRGLYVGFVGGSFIARCGNGSTGVPNDTANIEILPATYDFAGKTGRLLISIDLAANSISISFDEGDTGTIDHTATNVSVSAFTEWAGTDSGGVGVTSGSIAGSHPTTAFNGTIDEFNFDQSGGAVSNYAIDHWVHRNGNTVKARLAVIDISQLISAAPPAVTQETKVTSAEYAVLDQEVVATPTEYTVVKLVLETIATNYAIVNIVTDGVPAAYSILDNALDNVTAGYAVLESQSDAVATNYALVDTNVDTTPASYVVAIEDVDTVGAAYSIVDGSLDTVPTSYAVGKTVVTNINSQYGVQNSAQDTTQVDYAVAVPRGVAISSGYEVLVEGSEVESITTQYAVKTDALDSIATEYAVNTNAVETLPTNYAVEAPAIDTLPAIYVVITDALATLETEYAIAAPELEVLPVDYAVLVQSTIQEPAEYAVLDNMLDAMPVDYSVVVEQVVPTAALYRVETQTTLLVNAEYFVRLPTTVEVMVMPCDYALWDIETGCRLPVNPTVQPYTKQTGIYTPVAGGIEQAASPYTPAGSDISKRCL